MEKWEWLVDVFTFIGMAVCILIALIAIVWITCFLVKLLVKTFGVKVGKSYDLLVEDINKKSEAKKERNEKKRTEKLAHKMELLNMKLENKEKIHELKKAKLEGKLNQKENQVKIKLFGENASEIVVETKPVEKRVETKKPTENEVKESEEVFENIADVVDAVDGEVSSIEAIKTEEETKKKPAKKTTKKE